MSQFLRFRPGLQKCQFEACHGVSLPHKNLTSMPSSMAKGNAGEAETGGSLGLAGCQSSCLCRIQVHGENLSQKIRYRVIEEDT